MAEDKQALEVEIIEIDGVAPPPPAPRPGPAAGTWPDWRGWNGRVRRLDPRWWPLWVLLGLVALVAIVTVGLVAGVLTVTYLIARRLLFAIFPFLADPRGGEIR